MSSDVSICNNGLILVGADEINSFTDQTREAKVCAQLYPVTRDALIESKPWTFCRGQAQLNQLVNAPAYGFKYAYQLPSDFVRLDETERLDCPYRKHEDMIFTDMSPLRITYYFVPSEGDFSKGVTKALSLHMAAQLALALMVDESLSRDMLRLATQAEDAAFNADQQAQSHTQIRPQSFSVSQARYSSIGRRLY